MEIPSSPLLLAGYCVAVLVASLAGGWVPLFVRLTHTRLQVATSFVAGLMLGVGVLHLIPHSWHELESIDLTVRWLLGGFLVMFFVQRFFHFHHHDVPEESPEVSCCSGESDHAGAEHRHVDKQPNPAANPDHHHDQTLAERSAGHLSWSGAAMGLTLHTLIDGIALSASVAAESHEDGGVWLAGLGTFLVIVLHKPFDAMAIGTLMAKSGWSRMHRHLVNGLFALAIPAGALLFYFGAAHYTGESNHFLGAALAFAGGTFLCIAASDLLPELQFHTHDRGKLSLALVTGLVLAAVIGRFETHGHDQHTDETGPPAAAVRP